jgi:hypothetical protein
MLVQEKKLCPIILNFPKYYNIWWFLYIQQSWSCPPVQLHTVNVNFNADTAAVPQNRRYTERPLHIKANEQIKIGICAIFWVISKQNKVHVHARDGSSSKRIASVEIFRIIFTIQRAYFLIKNFTFSNWIEHKPLPHHSPLLLWLCYET